MRFPVVRYGTQPAGPALPGTSCGGGRRCYEGECVKHSFKAPPKPPKAPAFSDWHRGSCRHSCIQGAKPVVHSYRSCSDFSGCGDGPEEKVEVRKPMLLFFGLFLRMFL